MYKKQHWIPRCYLEAWCDSDIPDGYAPYVWLYSRDWNSSKKKAPENIFTENDMYTIKLENGERNLSIEHGLSGLETEFAKVIQNKVLRNQPLNLDERMILCAFVSATHERTPSKRDHLQNQWQKVQNKMEIIKKGFEQATPDQKNAMMQFGRATDGPSYSMDDVIRIAEHPLQEMMVPTIQAQTSILMRMNLTILHSISKARFLTSDNPCVFFDAEAKNRPLMYRGVGLGYETVEITLPVTPQHALLLSWRDIPQNVEFTRKKVESLNQRTWHYASEFVVSNSYLHKPEWIAEELGI
ncbi:DUF4238 domain-containing protein [Paenibacillus qinlingensis]|uniref:DUF4238 domain-containing protein n=1 Tax=Paenibacillus qinlingensis TaxID=1837343 RepID=A0ABU1NRC1_9BACL|nr:DUF4238 domain-containing protein [Paenibacillus qinlingensis]MDR6550031.1 hypothetical protein [Paenibacillus qinlingensis]